ncbi:bifunctional diguanylate cyclase/phosphodiesterase [Sinimarinibacterium sp. NLF-5-8]|uniref:bifunctional diguanylate cyclase/phosphodiesterase n=1 Tax=Sinimarinibacterium sp. NLF-5-8 TaxID=2698684 RepID=UPI00137BD970|nr:bifunctional diguanylate cyclase/phosphodiesterase [Sinimarinibacterium sp. NLF-5-8]QHS10240.1 EAL domain-containing protein [Sinimarinibacterium sp. NLF-5-8]
MTVRFKFIAVIVLVNLAIALAGAMIVPSTNTDLNVEPELRNRANRVQIVLVLQSALAEAHQQAELAYQAVVAQTDPASPLKNLALQLDSADAQLRFLTDPRTPETLRPLFDATVPPIRLLLMEQPLTDQTAAQLRELTQRLQYQAQRTFIQILQDHNHQGLASATQGLQALRRQLQWALISVGGALLLSLGLSVWAYRRLIRPLGAVTSNLNAVLTGHRPNRSLQETQDEFGDIVRAIHKLQAQAEHIRRIAYEDGGSNLPNRNRLEAELREVRRLRPIDGTHGLIMLSISNYESLRSGFGFRVAEGLMRAAGQRLQNLDHMPTTVFRVEPSALAILIDRGIAEAVTRVDLKRLVAEAFARLASPLDIDHQHIIVEPAAGAAIYPDDARDADEYINVSLEAMRLAQAKGPGSLLFGERGHTHRLRKQLALTEQIRLGLREGQFVPFFQPIIDAATHKVAGAEMLVRWRQPDGRVVLPGEFMRIVEGSEIIHEMTHDVLSQACRAIVGWPQRRMPLTVSFNVSARLLTPQILHICRDALSQSGLSPAQLMAEITETAVIDQHNNPAEILRALKAMGIRVCLDDFGTGYSSFAHLYSYDVDRIKIDAVVTRAAAQNQRAAEIIRSMAQLAARMGASLVAEGIETTEDAARLRDLGCNLQQGFLYARAVPADQFIEWAQRFEANASAA